MSSRTGSVKRQNWGLAEEPRQDRVDSEMDPRGSSVKGAVPPGGGMGGQTPNFVTRLLDAGICLGKPCRGAVSESLIGAQRHLPLNQDYEREWRWRVRGVEGKNWTRRHSGREQERQIAAGI